MLDILPYDEFKISDDKDAIYHITNDLQVQRKSDDGEFYTSLISINCLLNRVYDIKIISRYKDKYPDEE
ncbi:MAG: hypothetical protein MJ120_00115 [Clostridia bacterium]|nr:hypothetical protein [Clostridia bacterium]